MTGWIHLWLVWLMYSEMCTTFCLPPLMGIPGKCFILQFCVRTEGYLDTRILILEVVGIYNKAVLILEPSIKYAIGPSIVKANEFLT